MLKGKKALGVINVETSEPFTEYDEQLMTELADLAVIALSNAEIYAHEKDALERFQLLYEAGQELGKVMDATQIDQAYKFAVNSFAKHKEGQVAIRRYDEEKRELVLVHQRKATNMNPLFLRMSIDEGVNGWVARHRKTLVVGDTLEPPKGIQPKASDERTRSLVATPIKFGKTYYGNLALSHHQPHYFRRPDVMLIEGLAHQLGLTIKRLEILNDQQDAERRARESELMSSIGQSATELTHRLAGDLGLVGTYVEAILDSLRMREIEDPIIEENITDLLRDVDKVLSFNRALKDDVASLQNENRNQQSPTVISLQSLLEEAERAFPTLPTTINLIRQIDNGLPEVRVVPNQIISALCNLVLNAIQSMPEGGVITLSAGRADVDLEIAVEDTGVGIPRDIRSRIFSLFFSTKGSSGFGLWSALRNTIANGGKLKVESTVGKGSRFSVLLPPVEGV